MDWVACLLEICGAWLIGNKKKSGFIVFMIGNCFWFASGNKNNLGGLMMVSMVFFLINVRNWLKWRNEKETE